MVDHFTKYGWMIPLNDNKSEMIKRLFRHALLHIIFLIDFRLIIEESLENDIIEDFSESRDITRI